MGRGKVTTFCFWVHAVRITSTKAQSHIQDLEERFSPLVGILCPLSFVPKAGGYPANSNANIHHATVLGNAIGCYLVPGFYDVFFVDEEVSHNYISGLLLWVCSSIHELIYRSLVSSPSPRRTSPDKNFASRSMRLIQSLIGSMCAPKGYFLPDFGI